MWMRRTVLFVQFVVRDVYDETGKVVIVNFLRPNWRHVAFEVFFTALH